MPELITAIFQVLYILLNVVWWIIIIHLVLGWLVAFNVINTYNDLVRTIMVALDRMTQPLYRPVRRFMPDLGALDLTPMVVLLGVSILQRALLPALYGLLLRSVV